VIRTAATVTSATAVATVTATLLVALAASLPGCRRRPAGEAASPCGAHAPEIATLRDGDGVLVRALRGAAPRAAVCSPTGAVTGFLVVDSVKHEITTPAGATRARLVREGDADVTVIGTPALRLHDEGGELRVLRPDGVPLGAITRAPAVAPAAARAAALDVTSDATPDGGAPPTAPILANLYDAGGRPVGTVVAHGTGLAIRAPDGTTRFLVSPRPPVDDPRLAGLVAVTGLSPDDALAIAWAFPPPTARAK
jgi:hypothetical protein